MELQLDRIKSKNLIDLLSHEHLCLHASQLGEDALLWHMYKNKNKGFYLDVGCHHPIKYSNTFLLHKMRSWSGINIDPDMRAIELFNQYRPNDINICSAVSDKKEQVELTLFDEGAINTIDKRMAEKWKTKRKVKQEILMETETLSSLLDKCLPANQHIDLLDIDVEGYDYNVLVSNNWSKYRPDVIVIEDHMLSFDNLKDNPIYNFLLDVEYVLHSHLYITSIYIEKSFNFRKKT